MRRCYRKGIGALAGLMLWAGLAHAAPEKMVLPDADGVLVAPLEAKGQKAEVFFFITTDCPIANAYAPEIERICAAYAPKKIAFYTVYADPSLSATEVKKHTHDYGLKCPALLDRSHKLVTRVQATITPEVAVVRADGKLLYRGRIDDRYLDFGKARSQARVHDLRDTLDAILQGKPVPHPTTKAIGCFIPSASTK